jgi:hypothetical protein
MELVAVFRRVVVWRWTPCVAPVVGSVLIALLTLAVVPEEIGGAGASPLALRAKKGSASDLPAEDTATIRGATPGAHPGVGNGRPRMAADAVQGFFHQAQELPIEPVDPTPQAPPPEPPPPAPTATVFTLPEPTLHAVPPPDDPSVEPGTLPPPDVPLSPVGAGVEPPTGATPPPSP